MRNRSNVALVFAEKKGVVVVACKDLFAAVCPVVYMVKGAGLKRNHFFLCFRVLNLQGFQNLAGF
jgi:hypothetical protein